MLFDELGNAYKAINYTPESLEAEASLLRQELGEQSVVTINRSPFIADYGTRF